MFDEKFPEFFDSIQWFFGKVYDFGKLVVGSIFNGVSATLTQSWSYLNSMRVQVC